MRKFQVSIKNYVILDTTRRKWVAGRMYRRNIRSVQTREAITTVHNAKIHVLGHRAVVTLAEFTARSFCHNCGIRLQIRYFLRLQQFNNKPFPNFINSLCILRRRQTTERSRQRHLGWSYLPHSGGRNVWQRMLPRRTATNVMSGS